MPGQVSVLQCYGTGNWRGRLWGVHPLQRHVNTGIPRGIHLCGWASTRLAPSRHWSSGFASPHLRYPPDSALPQRDLWSL